MIKKVFIVEGNIQYSGLFRQAGYKEIDFIEGADLVVFTGGEDVTPELYERHPHPRTYFNVKRDEREAELYYLAKAHNIPCVGICRGAQFLNVMNGGELWQHIDGHATGLPHMAEVVGLHHIMSKVLVTSTHHQMMIPNEDSPHILLLRADESNNKQTMTTVHEEPAVVGKLSGYMEDVESVYYSESNDLCFQPHPEYFDVPNTDDMRTLFFFFINNYLFEENRKAA